jgi:thiol:disulfide interchange protein DsbD
MTSNSCLRRPCLLTLAVVAMFPVAASAGAIGWRDDYGEARREAAGSGRPVVVSVSARGCHWCRQLERTTFRDPRVVGLLNGRCVPLKVDANDPAHVALVEALRLQGVPTLAVITADGRIVANQSGYLDAPQFLSWLRPILGE